MLMPLTEEQSLLRSSLSSYLTKAYSFEARRAILASEKGWSPAIWRGLSEDMGILGVAMPEAAGGFGGGAAEITIVMEAFGRALMTEPVMETLVIGSGLVRRCAGAAADMLAAGIASGTLRLALGFAEPQARYSLCDLTTRAVKTSDGYLLSGSKAVVIGAAAATHYAISARTSGSQRDEAGISLFLVDAAGPGISRRDYRAIDGRLASEVEFNGVALDTDALLGPLDGGYPLLARVIEDGTVAICAEACGVLDRMLHDTVEYTKQRIQFGQPLAFFQVLRHRMVDMFIAVEQCVSLTMLATEALASVNAAERALTIAAAKAGVGKACRFVGHNAIQLHGGMGITDELAVGHFFKRAVTIESQFGSTDHHLGLYEKYALDLEAISETPSIFGDCLGG